MQTLTDILILDADVFILPLQIPRHKPNCPRDIYSGNLKDFNSG